MPSTSPYAALVTLATDSDDDPILPYDIVDKVKNEGPEGSTAIAYAVKRRFAYPNTDVKRRVLGLVDILVIECGADFHNAFRSAEFLITLADNRDTEIARLIPEHLEKWKVEMGSEYHPAFNQAFPTGEGSQSTSAVADCTTAGSTGLTLAPASGPLGQASCFTYYFNVALGGGDYPTFAHSSRQSTPYPLFSDRRINNGIYTITNVHHKRFVYLRDANDYSPLQRHYNPEKRGARWHVKYWGKEQYSIQNVDHKRYANCGRGAGLEDLIKGNSQDQQWCIHGSPEGEYTIATIDTRNFWMLPYDGPGTPVELFNIYTDRRCWWTFEKQEIEVPANENLTTQPVLSERRLVDLAGATAIPGDMDLDVPEAEPHLAERFVVSHIMPGDMDLDVVDSEPYLAERFGVHVPNLSGQVRRLDKGIMFPGTYSTVYPGMYGDKKVAIKELRIVKSSDKVERKFRRELLIWWHLKHDNVLPLYGYLEDKEGGGSFPSLISKWAENESAAQYIDRDLRWDRRTSLFYDVAKGLNYLHGFEPIIVHADLKPQNVVVNNYGVGQLCDFGLTRFKQDELETGLTTTSTHTGTVRYLAYELVVYEHKPLPTTATDMYALGCIGLEFIYRIRPHASLGTNQGKIIRAIGNGVPPARRPANPEEVISMLWDPIEACWTNAPEERPTATQVSDYLENNLVALSESLERCLWAP